MPPALVITMSPSYKADTVLFYGHLDKQPPLNNEWSQDRSPYKAKIEGDKLYGRGVSEGAVNFIATVLMLRDIVNQEERQHNRFVLLYETDKHSGSINVLQYFQ